MPKLKNTKKSDWEIINGVSAMGYRDDSPYRNMRSIDIYTPNGLIDMSETGIPLMANGRYLPPYSGMHKFDETVVTEYPIMQAGGRAHIYVDNPNDPRLQAYNDSLNLYNSERRFRNAIDRYGRLRNPYEVSEFQNAEEANYSTPTNRSISSTIYGNTYGVGANPVSGYYVNSFQRPVQPVVYKPIPEQTPISTQRMEGLLSYQTPNSQLEFPSNQGMITRQRQPGERFSALYTPQGEKYSAVDVKDKSGKLVRTIDPKTGKLAFKNPVTGEEQFEYGGELPEAGSGYKVIRSNERKGKTHKVIGPDGTVKFFGDSKLGQHPKDPARKKAFYARHAKNLKNNPYFRAFARKTWEEGGMLPDLMEMAAGGQFLTVDGEYHRIYRNAEGDIMVNHPKEDKGKWDTINLTDKAGAKTVADGVAATKKWHRENPYAFGGNIILERYGDGGSTWEILPKAQTGKITLDEFRPNFSNSNENIQQEIQKKDDLLRRSVGTKANPKMLPEIAITAKRQLDPSKKAFGTVYPDRTGSSAELASALFVTPLMETLHTPSRLVNQGISLYQGKGFAPYSSEISETLGWQNNDPTDLWASTRNFVADNVFDVLIPIEGVSQPSARFLTNLGEGVVEGAEAYGRSLGNTKRILRDYRLNQTPNFITPQNEELLSTVRNVGMSLKGEGDLYNPKILQNVLNRANSLNNTQFKNLTGFEKSEIEERIQKLLTGELKKPEPVASPTVDGLTREEFIRQQLIDLRRPERRQRLQELSTNIGRQNPTGWQTIESNITRPGDYDIDVINNSVDISRIAAEPNMFLHYYNEPNFNIVDKFNEKITERLNKKLGLIEKTEKPIDTKSLISGLYAREGEGAVRKKLLQAIKQVEGAKKGETFLASTSLSSDSYPLAHKFLPKMLKEGKVDVSYHGMQDLNPLGFANELGLPKNITLEEINTVIDNINKASGKRFPYAKIENKSIQVPIISATRKKFGGKVSKWEIVDDNEWEII